MCTITTVASHPSNFWVQQFCPATLYFSWTPRNPLDDTTGYRIYYSNYDSDILTTDVDGSSTNSHLATHLDNHLYDWIGLYVSIVGKSKHFFSKRVSSYYIYPYRKWLQLCQLLCNEHSLCVCLCQFQLTVILVQAASTVLLVGVHWEGFWEEFS